MVHHSTKVQSLDVDLDPEKRDLSGTDDSTRDLSSSIVTQMANWSDDRLGTSREEDEEEKPSWELLSASLHPLEKSGLH